MRWYWPSLVWWKLIHLLGYINARIILTVLFAVLLVPLNLVWRVTGKDPLGRRRAGWTGWSPYPARYRTRNTIRACTEAPIAWVKPASSPSSGTFSARKRIWLMPIVFVFLLFGILLIFAQSSALAPFIYSLF